VAGHIITIIGGKGGVGKSVVSASLAFSIPQELKAKSLLLDFDQKACGDLNIVTGLKSRKTLKDVAEFPGAFDQRTLTSFTGPPQKNVSFIGMPRDPVQAEAIQPESLGKLLKSVKKIFPITVIDGGSELTALTLKALEASTLIFVCTTPDILVVNQTKRILTDLQTMLFPKEMVQVILNYYQKGHPVTPDIIQKQLGKAIFAPIPKDEQSCVSALNKRAPAVLVNKSGGFAKGVVDILRRLKEKNLLKSLERLNKPSDVRKDKNLSDGNGKGGNKKWIDLKYRIHRGLHDEIDLSENDDDDPNAQIILREKCKKVVVQLLGKEDTKSIAPAREDMNRLVKEIVDEAVGLGPLEDMLADKSISEIMVNGPHDIFFEQEGKIKKSEITFTNDRQVYNVIEKIIAPIGRRIDEKVPYVDARLADGSRVHAIIKPCSLDGSTITIRKFPDKRLTHKDLINFGSMTQNMADFLRLAVEAGRNVVVSGGTGSGKTTLLQVLASFIPANQRIITVEDSAELLLPQDHVVRLETKPPSLEGEGEVSIRTLVKQTLRMRPDRIVVGECRGGEALDMLQAMNTGHDGSMTTVHSNSPRDCIGRLETLVQYASTGISPRAIKEMIASAVHLIVQQSRLDDGSRRITAISEVGGMQGDVITLQTVFEYKQKGMDKKGKIVGEYVSSGFIPKFVEKLQKKGYNIPKNIFNNG
jgi:pilus assembly protein CpaF